MVKGNNYNFIFGHQNTEENRKIRKAKYPLKVWQILNILVKTLTKQNRILEAIKGRLNRKRLLLFGPELFFLKISLSLWCDSPPSGPWPPPHPREYFCF